MARHWDRISKSTEFMMPSHDPDNDQFDAIRYRRGPIWIVVNYMLTRGFEADGLDEWTARVKEVSRWLISEHGFHAAFSPITGAGSGGRVFSSTAAIWLTWCGR